MRKINLIFLLLPLLLFTTGCNKGTVYKKYTEIPDKIWDRAFMPMFEVDIEDTSQYYNLNLHVRNASVYPYSNLWVFIHRTTPTGKTDIDTLECVLADASGEWLGDGMGDIWDNEILWIRNYKFDKIGTYKWKIEQAMRLEKVPGIMDIGFSIHVSEN